MIVYWILRLARVNDGIIQAPSDPVTFVLLRLILNVGNFIRSETVL